MAKRKTKEEFVADARKIHNDKYDYSKSKYINSRTKLTIICPIHGKFLQTPNIHLRGCGCVKCGKVYKPKFEEWVQQAKKIHDNEYIYYPPYINNHTKIQIKHKKCGYIFKQKPIDHTSGRGCPQCGGTQKLTTEKFIKKANQIHNNKYDYSKTQYINAKTKIIIICHIHGEFKQTPSEHLQGCGCKQCGTQQRIQKNTKSFKWFEQKAQKTHNNKYQYIKEFYTNTKIKIPIYCKKCKTYFWQTPHTHLKNKGCPKCNKHYSKGEEKIEKYLLQYYSHLKYKREYNFNNEKHSYQKFDFYFPDHNLAIEYNGEQHYKPINFSPNKPNTIKDLKKVQKRDKQKSNYCKKHGIKLLIIPYWDYNKIEEYLWNFIEHGQQTTPSTLPQIVKKYL